MEWFETGLLLTAMFVMVSAMAVLMNRVAPDVECPRCNRFPRSMREDGLCRICRDPQFVYMWAMAF